jgi:type IX secretion system PorP/SprF family membrane protein
LVKLQSVLHLHHIMRHIRLIIFIIFCFHTAVAQQKPYYTQYILNNYILNPALSGIENYTDVKISHRNQWSGLDGAPVTTYLSVHTPFGQNPDAENNTATSFGKRGNNVRGQRVNDDNTTGSPHHGAGLIVSNDKTGYINRFSLYGTYAYHKPLSPTTTLSAGIQLGFNSLNIDRSKITLYDPNDPGINPNNPDIVKFSPEIGAGLWLYSKDFFVGTSVLNIVPGKIKFSDSGRGTFFAPHFFSSAGYRFWLSDDFTVTPSINVQFVSPTPMQIHANAKLQYQDIAWIGASYRLTDQLGGFAAMAGFNISNTFNIGYAYDVSTNARLRGYTGNTHEVIIGFLLNNKYGDLCPRNVW